MITIEERARGTAFEVLYSRPKPTTPPLTEDEIKLAKKREAARRKYERQKARDAEKRIKRTETERILCDNKHLAAWTI